MPREHARAYRKGVLTAMGAVHTYTCVGGAHLHLKHLEAVCVDLDDVVQ